MRPTSFLQILSLGFCCFAHPLHANNGNHYGWCQGVGNPHRSSDCGGSSGGTTLSFGTFTPPTATTQPTPATGSEGGTTPVQIVTGSYGPPIEGFAPGPTATYGPPIEGFAPLLIATGNYGPAIVGNSPGPTPSYGPPITGYAPVQTVTGTYGPAFTGYSPVQTVTGTYGPAITGYAPVQTVTGTYGETVTGYAPVIAVTGTYGEAIVGYAPVQTVTGTYAPPITGYAPVQEVTGTYGETVVGYAPVQLIPRPRPLQRTPDVPGSPNQGTGSATSATHSGGTIASSIVPHQPGRQPYGGSDHLDQSGDDERGWTCLTGGHGPRYIETDGERRIVGTYSHIGQVDAFAQDVPARHSSAPHCLIALRRGGD